MNSRAKLTILAVSGLDPGGGAGARADAETAAALGARALAVITCRTRQDSVNAQSCAPADADAVRRRIGELAANEPIAAVKIGLTPSAPVVDAVADALAALPNTPVVLDPVLAAGGGYLFCDDATTARIAARLLPLSTVATPNLSEAARLAAVVDDAAAMAAKILNTGCGAVLITGESESNGQLRHRLYRNGAPPCDITCQRLPHRYHGSGCTLSSALAVELARGASIVEAARRAHDYTYRCLLRAPIPRHGNPAPQRSEA
ncbi:MAG: bifunctional hydroxymethylpyrimidine kinase/phosphomethylpyrimidine kinase [Gammaproteobacteria bacterium]|nr:bifunctional hydroxymethylpyrimidine kinase/phosphomethylpyrimidine kinase [Gammaproteobacteria bacterium]